MIIQHRSARICGEALAVAYTGSDPIFVCKENKELVKRLCDIRRAKLDEAYAEEVRPVETTC